MTEVLARRDTMPVAEVVGPGPSSPRVPADEDTDDSPDRDRDDAEEP